jgi:serine/threonine protein kinase
LGGRACLAAAKAQTVSDWERITALFGAARLLDADARVLFLDGACGRNVALRTEVERLLTDTEQEDSFLGGNARWTGGVAPIDTRGPLDAGDLVSNRYLVQQRIATGGQAIVYRATDTSLSRPVILKVMRGGDSQNRLLRARFEDERQALARLDHPAIVGILDVGTLAGGSPFLVVQYVDGVSLRQALQDGPLDPHRTASVLRQLGAALSSAHAAGIAHSDLKPENIMLQRLADGSETVKLIDFGIAKIDRSGLDAGVTSVMVAGTLRYMAPEQFEGQNSTACDIYALALVACEMMTGHPVSRALPKRIGRTSRRRIESAVAFRPEDRPRDVRRWCEQLARGIERGRTQRRRVFAVAASLIVFISATAFGVRHLPRPAPEPRRIIEKVGAFDPLVEGFEIHNELKGTVAENPARDGYDGWRVLTERQGHYFNNLTAVEKRLALEQGWRLSAVMRAEEGECFATVDFTGVGRRFDLDVRRRGAEDVVRLSTQLVPTIEGMEVAVPHDELYHAYELRYDAGLQTVDLWMDGTKRLSGYRGHTQFQGDGDIVFGVAVRESRRGVASFQDVRFEINP